MSDNSSHYMKILVVDDNMINHAILGSILREVGHDITTANSGLEALESLKENFFDLILMDIQMPEMDGIAATRKIRKIPGPKSEIPIVACTGDISGRHIREYEKIGMNSAMKKPIDKAELLEILKNCKDHKLHFPR